MDFLDKASIQGRDEKDVERAIERAALVWHHVSSLKGMNRCPVAKLYQVVAIPKLYIIGKDGKIIAKDLRGEELREKIDELFEG